MWYVIQVYTGREAEMAQKCRERVVRAGEEIFIPLAQRQTKIRGERTMIETKLFPGYIFIETEQIEDFRLRLKRIEGMAKLLQTGDDITPLEPQEEEYLKKLGGAEHIVRYSQGYLEGERLIVTSGPLTGYEGNVKKILRHKRLAVLEIPLLGRMVEVTLGLGVVERLDSVVE